MDFRGRTFNEDGAENWKTASIQLQAFTTPLERQSVKVFTYPSLITSFSAVLQTEEEAHKYRLLFLYIISISVTSNHLGNPDGGHIY
jgi:hypothetical protein